MVNTVFKGPIGRNLEVYVDDMIAKSKVADDHDERLREMFETLCSNRMRLNPEKCVFGVSAGSASTFSWMRGGLRQILIRFKQSSQ